MEMTLKGKITFANGAAAPGVAVRIFDKDAPGKNDDDLTLVQGITDARGAFTVVYDPGRYLDFARLPGLGLRVPDVLDILSPYLRLAYTVDGETRVYDAPLAPFQSSFSLPESAPLRFLPSQHGFAFPNNFPPINLPFTLPGFPSVSRITGGYGLCGGMAAAAVDYYLAGRPVPAQTEVPHVRTRLHRYLFRRAMDSFQMGESVLRFAQWMALDAEGQNGLAHLTLLQFEKLRAALDVHRLVPIGLVIAEGKDIRSIARDVWLNHQVLAYGIRPVAEAGGAADILVYDPNCPHDDDVRLRIERVVTAEGPQGVLYGATCTPMRLRISPMRVRGFFLMPYDPADPPEH
jgi:hypothetical protein